MTGFARVRRETPAGELTISLKSLNHRGLDIRFHSSSDIEPFENRMRARMVRAIRRGHVDVRVSFVRGGVADSVGLNRPMLEAYLAAFRQANEEFGLHCEPDLGMAFRTPGMLTEPVTQELDPEFEAVLLDVLDKALDSLNAFREREGAQLAAEIRARQQNIAAAAERIGQIRSRAVSAFQKRLNEKLSELLGSASIDPQRLVQEAAILADRSDIGEEVARLKIHNAQLGKLIDGGGEVGKRMDFLLQEMHRETNTILSKTNGVGEIGLEITNLALATKSDIEKTREQALNLE